jgi:hypothetical protein
MNAEAAEGYGPSYPLPINVAMPSIGSCASSPKEASLDLDDELQDLPGGCEDK